MDKKVLIIDDSDSIRTFLRVTLEAESYAVFEAGTAQDGLRFFEKEKPNLIILDLGLPDRDGMDVLKDMKRKTDLASKILILSVRDDNYTVEQSQKLGASGYMSKPFRIDVLLDKINSLTQ